MISLRVAVGMLAFGVAATVTALSNPAFANVTSVNVTAGGRPPGTLLLTTATSTDTINLSVVRNHAPITCPAGVVLSGITSVGNGMSPIGLASVTGSTWPSQSGALGCRASSYHASVTQLSTWSLNVTDQSTPSSVVPVANQTTPVSIYNVGLRMQVGTCRFDITGSIYGRYTNWYSAAPTLTVQIAGSTQPQANLTVGNIVLSGGATNCLAGSIVSGDKVVVDANTAFNVGAITSAQGGSANPLWLSGRP